MTTTCARPGYAANPLDDGTLDDYQVFRVPMTSMTVRATEGIDGITARDAARSKNLFALGLVSWMYSRPTDATAHWIEQKFASKPEIMEANLAAFRAGYNFGETAELLHVHYEVKPAPAEPGTYRGVNGTTATALGLIAASVRSGLPLFLASYPITPASELLHELSRHKRSGVRTVQAEDEIAAANMALGAAFGGHLGVTASSGPGMDLKQETIGLAVALELPLLVIDVQRAGPSTGMPTKTEAADLLMAIHGRHGESPLPVIAASTPAQCFDAVIEAARIAVTYRTPVILLSDTFLANSSEPWRLPDAAELPEMDPGFATGPNRDGEFWPYLRDERHVRPWAVPGVKGLQHVIGGLEKEDGTGHISYEPDNHALMTRLRADKTAALAEEHRSAGSRSRRGRRDAGARLGLDLRGDQGRGEARPPARRKGRLRPPPSLEPPPPQHGRGRSVLSKGSDPGDEHRTAREHHPRRVPDRRDELQQGGGTSDLRRGTRRRDHRAPMSTTNGTNGSNGGAPQGLTKKDFSSDQETRWCPGCGDYAILATVQQFLPELGLPPERIVFVAGIGCAGRFAYYMNTYGVHGIHGRAPALATGLALARPDLSIWVVSGDGDALSIGGNHLIHALRRNVPIKVLLFNNQIYGLTKGQYSPTSEEGKVTKSTPFGSLDHPFNPVALALGAEATFVARTVDTDRDHQADVLRAAAAHEGSALVEIYQNCNVFNDGAFDAVRAKGKEANQIRLEDSKPIRFGAEGERGVVRDPDGSLRVDDVTAVGEDALVVHNPRDPNPSQAFALAHLSERPTGPTPIGVFRAAERPVFAGAMTQELETARAGRRRR